MLTTVDTEGPYCDKHFYGPDIDGNMSMVNFQTLAMDLYHLQSEMPRLGFKQYSQVILTAL